MQPKHPTKSKQYSKTESDCSIFADKSESTFFCCNATSSIWVLASRDHDEDEHGQVEDIENGKGSNQANVEGQVPRATAEIENETFT